MGRGQLPLVLFFESCIAGVYYETLAVAEIWTA